MRDDAQLLDLAVITRIGHRRLEILIDTVDRHAVVGELLGDGGEHARLVVDEEPHGERGAAGADRRLGQLVVHGDGWAGAALSDVAGFGDHVADDGGSGRSAARTAAVEHEVVGRLGLDEHGVE